MQNHFGILGPKRPGTPNKSTGTRLKNKSALAPAGVTENTVFIDVFSWERVGATNTVFIDVFGADRNRPKFQNRDGFNSCRCACGRLWCSGVPLGPSWAFLGVWLAFPVPRSAVLGPPGSPSAFLPLSWPVSPCAAFLEIPGAVSGCLGFSVLF